MAVKKLGELVELLHTAAVEHGASPMTEVRVRLGPDGAMHRIKHVKGTKDLRGFSMILELYPEPEGA